MSAFDELEEQVAASLRTLGLDAERTGAISTLSDVHVTTTEGLSSYIEVKMDDAQFASPRFKYNGVWTNAGKKSSLYTEAITSELNSSWSAAEFVSSLTMHVNELRGEQSCSGSISVKSAAASSEKKDSSIVRLNEMGSFLSGRQDSYVMKSDDVDVTSIIAAHYLSGKDEPAHYLQFGDNFYRFSNTDPLKLGIDVPVFSALGRVAVRVAMRAKRYEVQAEVKPKRYEESSFSVVIPSSKKNPFSR